MNKLLDVMYKKTSHLVPDIQDTVHEKLNTILPKVKTVIKRSDTERKESQLARAIMRFTGRERSSFTKQLVDAIAVKRVKTAVVIGIFGNIATKAKHLHDGHPNYSIPVTDKMRKFFLAMYIRGLISAPLRNSTTAIIIPKKEGKPWAKTILEMVRLELNRLGS